MRASAVFTPNKEPGVTYVDDHLIEKAKLLRQSLETGAGVVSLSGPSKSGKTVFIDKNIGRDRLVTVTGAGVNSPEMLWNRVFAVIGTPIKVSASASTAINGKVGVKGSAGVPLVAKGEVSAEASAGHTSVSGWPRHLEATVVMREHRDHVGDLVGGFGEGHRGVLAMARRRCRCREHSDGAAGRERLCAPPLDGVAVLSRLAATGGATTRRAGCSTAWACA